MFKTIFAFLRHELPRIKPSWLLLGVIGWAVILILAWWLGPDIEIHNVRPLASFGGAEDLPCSGSG